MEVFESMMSYTYKDFTIVQPYTLTANQVLNNVAIPIDKDSDFIWAGTMSNITGGSYGFQFQDSNANLLSSGYDGPFSTAAFTVGIGVPEVVLPNLICPAGSSIIINLINNTGGSNGPIYFLLRGQKRFVVNG